MIKVELADQGWFRAHGLSGRVLNYVKQILNAKDRHFSAKEGCWFIKTEHLLTVVRLGILQEGHVSYADLPPGVQMVIAKAKEKWTVEDRPFAETYKQPETNQVLTTASAETSPYNEMYLIDGTPLDIVTVVWRHLAKTHHPDHGGDANEFMRFARAYKEIKKRANG